MSLDRVRGELLALGDALLTVLLPPRCGVCDEPLAARAPHGACAQCLEAFAANDGPRCPRCDAPGPAGVCDACRTSPPPFAGLWAPWLYGGALAESS